MTPPNPIIVRKLRKQELRDIWNDPAFQSTLLKRTTQRVDVFARLAPPDAQQEPGTVSHVYDFMDHRTGELLGTFHAYKRPDGSIGASGMYDPIMLRVDNTVCVDP
jgi:hypothetical protein